MKLPRLGLFGLLRLLIRAIATYAGHQAAIATELKILNKHIERIWPPAKQGLPVTEEPLLGDDYYTLALAADAESVLQQELGRAPSTEEILERMKVWQERRDPLVSRGAVAGMPDVS